MTSFWLYKWPITPESEPRSVGICLRLLPYAHVQHINVLKHYNNVLCGCSSAVSLNHDKMTSFWLHKWPRTTKSDPSSVGVIYLRLLPYAQGQHINVLNYFVYVWCRRRKHFEVAVSLNHDITASFWFHKWPRITEYDPSKVGITVRGYV